MYAGRMTEKLVITRPATATDNFGHTAQSYIIYGAVWGERIRYAGREIHDAGESFAAYDAEFNIRWAHDVKEGWRVEYEGATYDVTNVLGNRKRGMRTLKCTRVNL